MNSNYPHLSLSIDSIRKKKYRNKLNQGGNSQIEIGGAV